MFLRKKLNCEIIEKKNLSKSVFTLRCRAHRKFRFRAGQFVSVDIPTLSGVVRRCYSIASGSDNKKQREFELCIKRVDQGKGTSYLDALKPGDSFIASGPHGLLTYDERFRATKRLLLVATGTGIAPIRSILLSEDFQKYRPEQVVVLFGASDESEILYKEEIEKLGVKFEVALSRPKHLWSGYVGRVTDFLKTHFSKEWLGEAEVFTVGAGEMVADVVSCLRFQFGLTDDRLHYEAFSKAKFSDRRKSHVKRSSAPAEAGDSQAA